MWPKLFLLCVVLVLRNSLQDEKKYDFRPESRHYDVNEGGEYYIGFDEIQNLTDFDYCYIQSDGFNIAYEIVKNRTKPHMTEIFLENDSSNDFEPNNGTGICAFYIKNVDEKSPQKWTITAHNYTGRNYTEDVSISFYYNMPTYLDKIYVLPSASFGNFFYHGKTNLTKCVVAFANNTVQLDMASIKVYSGENVLKSRLSSIGDARCGFKVISAQKGDPSEMTLYATDSDGKTYKYITPITIVKGKNLENRTQEVYLGDRTTVYCGKTTDSSVDSDQKFCHLYNPKGELVSHEHMCEYDLDIVTMDDLGTWSCVIGYDHIMDSLAFTTELVEKPSEKVVTFTKDTSNYLIIGCRISNFEISTLDYCKFTRPDGRLFKVVKGSSTEFYSTFTSDLDKGICSLEIIKPVREEDKGTWKCEPVQYGDDATGAFLDVEKSTTFNYSQVISRNIYLGNKFSIDCMVPFASDHCYIIAPNGTQYQPDKNFQIFSGSCSFTIEEAMSSDNGTWSCTIAQKNGIPDDRITVEISIIELKVLYANAEVVENEEATLICNTNGILLEYCRFVSPLGESYSLRKEDTISKNRLTYLGRGLEYGDCGIKIFKASHADNGLWQCHISSGRHSYRNKNDITQTLSLAVSSSNSTIRLAESVGIAAGVLVVVIVSAAFVYHRYNKRRTYARANAPAQYVSGRSSGSSTGSGGETVILTVRQGAANEQQVVQPEPSGSAEDPQII